MHEIALTRRHVVEEGELADVGKIHAFSALRSPAMGAAFVTSSAWLGGLALGALGWMTSLPERLVLAISAAILAASLLTMLQWLLHVRRTRTARAPELRPGTVVESGVVAGFLRLRGSEDDLIVAVPPETPFTTISRMVAVGYHPFAFVLPRKLMLPEDQALATREARVPTVPARAEGEEVALTHEFLLDGRYSRIAARASMTHRHRTPSWWLGCALRAVGLTGYLALLARLSDPLLLALLALVLFVVFVVVGSRRAWTLGQQDHGGKDGTGDLVRVGFGPDGVRLRTRDSDVVLRHGAISRLRVLRDVIQLVLPDGDFQTIPRSVLTGPALDHLVGQVALVGRR